MYKTSWPAFFLVLARIFALLILLAVLVPKVASVCQIWITSITNHDENPRGNPMKVKSEGGSVERTGLLE